MSTDHIVRGTTVAGTNDGSFAPHRKSEADASEVFATDAHPMATMTVEDFMGDDDYAFARETLGPDAPDDEIEELVADRAQAAYDEYLTELDLRFPGDEEGRALSFEDRFDLIAGDKPASDLPRVVTGQVPPTVVAPGDEIIVFAFEEDGYPEGSASPHHGIVQAVEPLSFPADHQVRITFTDGRRVDAVGYAKCVRLAPPGTPIPAPQPDPEWKWNPNDTEVVASRDEVKLGDEVRCYMIGLGVPRALLGATGKVVAINGRVNAKLEFRGPLRNDIGQLVLREGDVVTRPYPYQLLLRRRTA